MFVQSEKSAADRCPAKKPLIRRACRPDALCSVICGQEATPVTASVAVQVSKTTSAQRRGDKGSTGLVVGTQGDTDSLRSQEALTICDRKPSILLLDFKIIANVLRSDAHLSFSLIVLLLRLIVFWSLGGRLDLLGLFWGLRHL